MNENIMNSNKHQFIYGIEQEKRDFFLKDLEERYPIQTNCKNPMAIHMKEYILNEDITKNNEVDLRKLYIVARYHFDFCIIWNIIDTILKQKQLNILEDRMDRLFDFIRRMSLYEDLSINSLENLKFLLEESRDFYIEAYQKYLKGENFSLNINKIEIPFIMSDWMIPRIKELLNNDSYFGIIIDKQENFSIGTTKAINNYLTNKKNRDIVLKIICKPNLWDTYYDEKDRFAEHIQDYTTVNMNDPILLYKKRYLIYK